jgi:capsular polysaccharide biosynthesis protein
MIIIITLLAGIAGYSYAKFVLPLQYTSSIKIYVTNGSRSDEDQNQINAQDLNTARSLAATYIVILDDTIVYEKISDRLIEDYDIEDLKNYFTISINDEGKEYIPTGQIKRLISISAINNTEVLQVTVTSQVPKFSADICTYISDIAPEIIMRTTKAGSVESIGSAKVPTSPSGPDVKKYAIIGVLLGAVIAIAIIIIRKLLDNCINSAEEIKQKFGIPVLGEIPDLEIDEKEGNRYEY